MVTHSSILAWRIPWTEEPGRCSPWGHRVRHDLVTKQQQKKDGMHVVKHTHNKCWYLFYFIIIIANTKLYDWWLETQPKAQTGAGDKSGESLQKGGVFQPGRGEVEAGGPLGSMHVEGGPPAHLQHSRGLCNMDITSSA